VREPPREEWGKLTSQGLDVIVHPFVFRVGQFFLIHEYEAA
jgi:hypothetical protein